MGKLGKHAHTNFASRYATVTIYVGIYTEKPLTACIDSLGYAVSKKTHVLENEELTLFGSIMK